MGYVFSLPIDDINVSKFTPFPGSLLYRNIQELGAFDEDWEKMDCMHFQFVPKGMTRESLERLFTLFYKTHFLRARVLLQYLTMVWRSPDSWVRFLSNLVDFVKFARTNRRLAVYEKVHPVIAYLSRMSSFLKAKVGFYFSRLNVSSGNP